MSGKNSKDNRTPDFRKRRENIGKINWCKHEWFEFSCLLNGNERTGKQCKKCGKVK